MTVLPQLYRRSVFTNYTWVGAQALVTIVMTPVLVSALGPTGYGVWTLALSLVLYLELLEFGFGKSTVRFVAYYEARGDRDGVERTITTSLGVLAVPGMLALIVGFAVAAVFPSLFNLDPQVATAARWVCVLFAVDLACSIPSDTFGATLQGLQRFDLVNTTLIVGTLAQAVAWAIVAALGGGLVALATVTAVIGLGGQLSRFLVVRSVLDGPSISRRRFDRKLVRPLGSLGTWFFVRDLATIVVHRIDVLVVGLVVGVTGAAVYAVGQKLSLLADRAIWPATVSFFPQMAGLSAGGNESSLRTTAVAGTRIALAIAGPVCLTLILLSPPIIQVWVGERFSDAASVVAFLAAAIWLKALTHAGVLALEGMGQARFPALAFAGEGALNLGLSVVLGHVIGLTGVALATLVATCVVELALVLPYLSRKLGLTLAAFLKPILLAHLPPVAMALITGVLVRPHVEGVISLAAAAIAIPAAYLATFLFTGLNGEERQRLTRLVRMRQAER